MADCLRNFYGHRLPFCSDCSRRACELRCYGTTGALKVDIELGDVIILVAAVRADGTTKEYVGDVYPTITSSEIARALKNVAK